MRSEEKACFLEVEGTGQCSWTVHLPPSQPDPPRKTGFSCWSF